MCGTLRPSSVVPWGLRDGKDSGHVMPQVARTSLMNLSKAIITWVGG